MPDHRFLLDANMPRSSAEIMRSMGLDVEDVRDIGMKASSDHAIIRYALETKRIVVTRDMDFGELLRYPLHPGSIILRLPFEYRSDEINRVLKEFFQSIKPDELANAIIIVELGRYRRRSL